MSGEAKELTLFEKIANHQIPSTMVYEDDQVSIGPTGLICSVVLSEILIPVLLFISLLFQRFAATLPN